MLVAIPVAYFEPAFLLAAQRAFISSESLFRPAGVSAPFFRSRLFVFLLLSFLPPSELSLAGKASFDRPV
jgi:hypothetical protein